MVRVPFIVFIFMLLSLKNNAQISVEHNIRLVDHWSFLKQDLGSVWEAVRPAGKGAPETVPVWSEVSLPHCFNAEDAVDPDVNYYQGPGWYKKLLNIENPYKNGRTLLHFEGAGQKTTVFIYTEEVGSHIGGYDEWSVDITGAVERFLSSKEAKRFKGQVPLIIRCDNSRDTEMIPSDLSDFNLYGGIYRYLNLRYMPAIAVEKMIVNAVVDEKGKKGSLAIKTAFTAHADFNDVLLNIKIFDPAGKLLKEQQVRPETQGYLFRMDITMPRRWSPESPALYTCEVILSSPYGDMTCREKFGFRHFRFLEKGPFMLNGKRLLLRGTHRHEDHAGVAAAMTEEMIIKEMELMKAMGVNFIRLGHYQQSRIVLEQCDKLGLLVWEEIPWCRGGLGGEVYKEQARRMLTNMIEQHRNHPSIILWGLGNENDWPNDFPTFDQEAIRVFMKELHDLSHSLDDSRLTCIRRCGFCSDIVDVYSPSIWAGWYRGLYTDYKTVTFNEMQQVKHFLHVEWGGDSHAGRHAENSYNGLNDIKSGGTQADERGGDASLYGGIARASKDGDWSETYICDLIDWHLKEQETMEWLTGTAYWPFKDFSTPVRPENPIPYMNQKGVVERDLTPKESYYVFQSYWTTSPMIHIYGHTWEMRWGKEGENKMVKIYSNCDEVELFLNGKSVGRKKRDSQNFPAAGLHWEIPFDIGQNSLKAIGWKGKKSVTDETAFYYETRPFGKESEIRARMTDIDAEYAWVEAEFVDENGVPCLSSRKYFRFELSGDGKLVVNQGTATGSKYVQAFNGRGRVKLRKNAGESRIAVKSEGLKTVFLEWK